MWALQRLRKLLTTEYGQSININRLLGDSEGEARSMVSWAYEIYEWKKKRNLSVITHTLHFNILSPNYFYL